MASKAEEIYSVHELHERKSSEDQDQTAAGKTKGGTATDLHEMQVSENNLLHDRRI